MVGIGELLWLLEVGGGGWWWLLVMGGGRWCWVVLETYFSVQLNSKLNKIY